MAYANLADFLRKFRATNPDFYGKFEDDELRKYIQDNFPRYSRYVTDSPSDPKLQPIEPTEPLTKEDRIARFQDRSIGDRVADHAKNVWFTGKSIATTTPAGVEGIVAGRMLDAYNKSKLPPEEEEKLGWFDSMKETYIDAMTNVATGTNKALLKKTIGWLTPKVVEKLGPERIVNRAERSRKTAQARVQKMLQDNPDMAAYQQWNRDEPMSAKKLITDIDMWGRGISTLLPSIIASASSNILGGPTAGIATMFSMEGGGEYNEAMEYMVDELGMDPAEAMPLASQAGLVYGGIASILEQIGMNSLMKYTGLKDTGRKALSRKIMDWTVGSAQTRGGKILKGAGSFSIQNLEQSVQEWSQNIAQLMTKNAYKKYSGIDPETGEIDPTAEGFPTDYDEATRRLISDFKDAYNDPSSKEAFLTSVAGFGGYAAGMGVIGKGSKAIFGGPLYNKAQEAKQRYFRGKGKGPAFDDQKVSPVTGQKVNQTRQQEVEIDNDDKIILNSFFPPDDPTVDMDLREQEENKAFGRNNLKTDEDKLDYVLKLLSKKGSRAFDEANVPAGKAGFLYNVGRFFSEELKKRNTGFAEVIDEADKRLGYTGSLKTDIDEGEPDPFPVDTMERDAARKASKGPDKTTPVTTSKKDIATDDVDWNAVKAGLGKVVDKGGVPAVKKELMSRSAEKLTKMAEVFGFINDENLPKTKKGAIKFTSSKKEHERVVGLLANKMVGKIAADRRAGVKAKTSKEKVVDKEPLVVTYNKSDYKVKGKTVFDSTNKKVSGPLAKRVISDGVAKGEVAIEDDPLVDKPKVIATKEIAPAEKKRKDAIKVQAKANIEAGMEKERAWLEAEGMIDQVTDVEIEKGPKATAEKTLTEREKGFVAAYEKNQQDLEGAGYFDIQSEAERAELLRDDFPDLFKPSRRQEKLYDSLVGKIPKVEPKKGAPAKVKVDPNLKGLTTGRKSFGDELDESHQRTSEGKKIVDNRPVADAIISRLKKTYPAIKGQELDQVFDKHGIEVAGKAMGMVAQWSRKEGGLETPPHEYAHIYLDSLDASGNKFIRDGISKFREEGTSDKDAKENLADLVGKYYEDRIQDKSLKNKLKIWLRRFWLETKKMFTGLNRDEAAFLVSERFFRGKGKGQVRGKGAVGEQYQAKKPYVQPGSLGEQHIFDKYTEAWDLARIKMWKEKSRIPDLEDFSKHMKDILPEGQGYREALERWKGIHFSDDQHLMFNRSTGTGKGTAIAQPKEFQEVMKDRWKGIAEGLSRMDNTLNDIDIRGVGKLEISMFHALGNFAMKKEQISELFQTARKPKNLEQSFDEWLAEDFIRITNLSKETAQANYRELKQYWVGQKNKVYTNTEGRMHNDRDHLVIKLSPAGPKMHHIKIKGPVNDADSSQNTEIERKMLGEWHDTPGVHIKWLDGSDVLQFNDNIKRWEPAYNFLGEEHLIELAPKFKQMGIVPAFSRGDSDKIAFATITTRHRELAKDPVDYWTKRINEGRVQELDPDTGKSMQMENLMGNTLSEKEMKMLGINTSEDLFHYRAEEIARFEAIEAYMPGMFKTGDGPKLFKRIKIPFTPTVMSGEMKDSKARIFDPSRTTFVSLKGKVTPATRVIPDHGKEPKYIGDGGTITGASFFKSMTNAIGLSPKARKAKTVIYENSDNGLLTVKHQHYSPAIGTEIWYDHDTKGAEMIAKINENGEIEDANGNILDLLLTKDEAKIMSDKIGNEGSGFGTAMNTEEVFTVKGSSIGLIKYAEKPHKTAKHPMQWYNYIRDDENTGDVIAAFREHILPQAEAKVQEVFDLIKDDKDMSSAEKVLKLFKKLEGEYPDGLAHNLVAKAELGAAATPDLEGMLNVLAQTQILEKGLQLAEMPGTLTDLVPNLEGDLELGEVSPAFSDSKFIIDKYKEEVSADKDADVDMNRINEWLKTRDLQVLVSRSPIAFAGGATMMRVAKLHNRHGLGEIHPEETFRRLEGDNDGDEIQIELLPDEMIDIYKKASDNVKLKGFNIKDMIDERPAEEKDISSRLNMYELMDAMVFGTKAIGEIANLQSVYGMLLDQFDHAVIDGETIKVRPVDMKLQHTPLPDVLRYFLQAAVDNAEHLALKQWNYSQERIARKIFIVEGRPEDHPNRESFGERGISDAQWEAVRMIVNQHKLPGRFRQGRDQYQNAFRIRKSGLSPGSIEDSHEYLRYVEDRDAFLKQKTKEWSLKKKNIKAGIQVGKVENYVFNEGRTIAEDLIVMPALINRKEREENPDLYAHRSATSPFEIPVKIQVAFHTSSIGEMAGMLREMAVTLKANDDAAGRDFFKEIQIGQDYVSRVAAGGKREGMGVDYYELLMDKLISLGPQAMEKNEELLTFVEDYGKEFEVLSETAQIAATIKFLEGFDKMGKSGKLEKRLNAASFPPYGDTKKMYSLLSPKVMLNYNREYNKLLQGKSEGLPSFKSFDRIVEELCK